MNLKHFASWTGLCETMALAFIVWLCTLPLVGLLAFPLFGSRAALLTTVGLLLALIPVCWSICSYLEMTRKEIQR